MIIKMIMMFSHYLWTFPTWGSMVGPTIYRNCCWALGPSSPRVLDQCWITVQQSGKEDLQHLNISGRIKRKIRYPPFNTLMWIRIRKKMATKCGDHRALPLMAPAVVGCGCLFCQNETLTGRQLSILAASIITSSLQIKGVKLWKICQTFFDIHNFFESSPQFVFCLIFATLVLTCDNAGGG